MNIVRDGQARIADEVFHAWTSKKMPRMLAALNLPTHPLDRHFLLLSIVEEAYKGRDDPEMRSIAEETAWKHVAEFGALAVALRREFRKLPPPGLPHVPTFQHLATLMVERNLFSKAVEVCEFAMQFGLTDGTKGGFDARIQKIEKQEQKVRGG